MNTQVAPAESMELGGGQEVLHEQSGVIWPPTGFTSRCRKVVLASPLTPIMVVHGLSVVFERMHLEPLENEHCDQDRQADQKTNPAFIIQHL